MVFSFVFTNCHLPSAILLCKKPANLTTNRLKRHIITHFVVFFAHRKFKALSQAFQELF